MKCVEISSLSSSVLLPEVQILLDTFSFSKNKSTKKMIFPFEIYYRSHDIHSIVFLVGITLSTMHFVTRS